MTHFGDTLHERIYNILRFAAMRLDQPQQAPVELVMIHRNVHWCHVLQSKVSSKQFMKISANVEIQLLYHTL